MSSSKTSALQVYGRKKCRETQKGERWLKERGIEFHAIDLDQKPLAPSELDTISRAVGGVEALVDTSASVYTKKGYAYLEVDLRGELLEHPQLLRTPILRRGSLAVLGFDPSLWLKLT